MNAASGVSWKDSVLKWKLPSSRSKLVFKLLDELKSNTYEISEYNEFWLLSPKKRKISSMGFRDRVAQRAMCDLGLEKDLMDGMSKNSCACQKGKGIAYAEKLMKSQLKAFISRSPLPVDQLWCMKLDISKFFDSISHEAAMRLIEQKVENETFKKMCIDIVKSFRRKRDWLGISD